MPPNPADIWLDDAVLIDYVGFTGPGTGHFSAPSGSLIYPSTLESSAYFVVNANGPAPIPEPTALALLAITAIATFATRRRKSVPRNSVG